MYNCNYLHFVFHFERSSLYLPSTSWWKTIFLPPSLCREAAELPTSVPEPFWAGDAWAHPTSVSEEPQSQLTEPCISWKALLWSDVHLAEVVHFGEQALQLNCLGAIIFTRVELKKQVFLPGWLAVLWIKSSLRSLSVVTKNKISRLFKSWSF